MECGVSHFLFITHNRAPGLPARRTVWLPRQASAHSQRVVLHGRGSAEPCRSCLCLFAPCPPSPTMDFCSQVRHSHDTELEEWTRDRSCAQSTGTHSAACPVRCTSLCLKLWLFMCCVLFFPSHFCTPGLAGREHDAAAAPQAPAHLVHEPLHGCGSSKPRRSCLCPAAPRPQGPTLDFWSQV
jgi:hypothetical protein